MPVAAKVSIIVPVFNTGKKLIPSIKSLLNQTLGGIEINLVDDASTDGPGDLIDQLALKYKKRGGRSAPPPTICSSGFFHLMTPCWLEQTVATGPMTEAKMIHDYDW